MQPFTPASADWLRVARIVRPQGHRGEVIAELLTDFPERFQDHPVVSLRAPGSDTPTRSMTIEQYRLHGGRIVFRFAECVSMSDAETIRDWEVVVPWQERMPLPEDEVYIAELAGCVLVDTRTGKSVGTITDVDRESSNTALLVVEAGGDELLVPFVKAYAPTWNLEARTLHMELPEGLLELHLAASAAPAAMPPDLEE